MRELFVYYRVLPQHVDTARVAVSCMHAALCERHPGLRARLLERPFEPGAARTWMETYRADCELHPGGVDETLQADIAAAALALSAWTDGPRHTEVFIACAS